MKKLVGTVILVTAAMMLSACGGGGSGDGVATPPFAGKYFAYPSDIRGYCECKVTTTITGNNYEMLLQGLNNGEKILIFGMRGIISYTATDFHVAITQLYSAYDGTQTWYDSSSPIYLDILSHMGGSSVLEHKYQWTGTTFNVQTDFNGDGDYDDEGERIEYTTLEDDLNNINGHGVYPLLDYVGVNFWTNNEQICSIYLSANISPSTTLTAMTVDLQGPGTSRPNLPATYFPARREWGVHPYDFGAPAAGGLWWVSKVVIETADGARTIATAANPWQKLYTFNYRSSGGLEKNDLPTDAQVGQDYIPEPLAAGQSYFYIETFKNASSTDDSDPSLKVFTAADLNNWIAFDDDGSRDDLCAGLKVPLTSGQTYYVAVEDRYRDGGSYSILLNTAGFTGSSSATVNAPDAYEPDDTAATAKPLVPDVVQDHSFTQRGDVDWFVITVP